LICAEEKSGHRSAAQQWADYVRREHPDLPRSQLALFYQEEAFDHLSRVGLLP
jgi:hypothetical protein